MAHLMQYTNEEKEAIKELKKRTFDELTPALIKDETLYYRFLKARDFNVDEAETMLRKHFEDRKIYDVEGILKHYEAPNDMDKYFATSFLGYSKDGNVVRYYDVGGADFRGAVHTYSFKDFNQYVINYREKDMDLLTEQSKKFGKPITQTIMIFNMDKTTLFQATYKRALDYLFQCAKLNQDNYPERIKAIYIINASFYFHIGFAVIKTIIAPELMKKFHIFGRTGWKEVLLEIIDADDLPAFLGGDRTDPDGNPLCNSFQIVHGKKIPEEYYKYKTRKVLSPTDLKIVTIPRSSKHEVRLEVDSPDIQIEWEYQTKNGDVGFVLLYKEESENDDKLEELMPYRRVDTKLSSEVGVYNCYKVGTYIIVFDNSYSWIYSKEVSYRISLNKVQNNNFDEEE